MITEFDLNSAIAECQGVKNPNAKTCIALAAFLTIKKELFGETIKTNESSLYSHETLSENERNIVTYQNNTEFSKLIYGQDVNKVLTKVDDLMSTLQILNKRLYKSVLKNLASEG